MGGREGGRELPLVLATVRGNVFSLMYPTATRLDKQPSMHMHTRVQAAHCHSHLSLSPEKPSFHSKACAFCVFPKSHSSNGDASPSCKPTFLRAASQAPSSSSCPCLHLQA